MLAPRRGAEQSNGDWSTSLQPTAPFEGSAAVDTASEYSHSSGLLDISCANPNDGKVPEEARVLVGILEFVQGRNRI